MRLQGKIGIVTAAGSGMGREGALRFAREGAAVTVVDLDAHAANAVVAEITAAGGRALALSDDLRADAFAKEIVHATVREFGALDFVWNHVGHPGPAAVEGIDMSQYELAMDLNLRSVLVTTDTAIPELRKRGSGSLLYTASISGIVGSAGAPVYSMAKIGVVGFVRSLSKRMAKINVRVNAICPGPVDTPMLRVFVNRADQEGGAKQDVENQVVLRTQGLPFGRPAKAVEIANAALFLLSDEASYISGIALPVDGAATA